MPLKISAFPKCYLEDISLGRMSVFEWIRMARSLDADGLEMYEGFLRSPRTWLSWTPVAEAIHSAGFAMPMLCCSPDFTAPDQDQRKRAIDREAQMIEVTPRLGGPGAVCRVLRGHAIPRCVGAGTRLGVRAIELLPVAREHDVILGMENHYKDGFWKYPEFAQKCDRFVAIVKAIPDRANFGVQYDPSNAIVAGDDPIELLRE